MPRKSQISDLGSHDRSHHDNDEDNNNNHNDHDHHIPAVATSYTVPTDQDDQVDINTNNSNNINNRPSSGYRLQQQQQQETSSPRFAPDVVDYNNATSPRSQKSGGGGGGGGGTRASTFSSRHGNNRSTLRNSRVSDTGIEFRTAEPSATFFTTVVAEIASIIGAGILSVNQSALYMGFGNSLIVLSFFWLVSMFSCYVLSVCSEYVGIFSQSQMLTACLCGGPQTIYDISIVKRYKLQQEQEQQQKENTRASGVSLSQQQQQQQEHNNDDDDEREKKNNNDDSGERLPLLLPKVDSAASLHSIVSPDTDPYVKAVLDAQVSRNRINLSIDILNGLTYLLYIVAYSRALADSGVSISKDLNFPGFFQHKVGWLVIAGVIYLALSLRRVFAELTISCVFGVLSIMFVVLCIIIRYFDPFEIHYLPISDYPPAAKSGSDSFYLGSSFLQAFSVISSAYAYQVNHPPFYLELKQRSPANMQKTVVVSNTFVYLSYIVTVCFGLALFGSYVDNKEAGGNIVNVFSADDILINVARFMLMIHFVTVIPITICTTRQNFHRVYLRLFGLDDRADDVDEVFTVPFYTVVIEAVTAILIGLVLADTVPGIAVVIGICGALGGGVSIMILPGLCGMKVFSEFHERGFTGTTDDDDDEDEDNTKANDNSNNTRINQTADGSGMIDGVTPTNSNNPQTPTIVRNQTSATPSNRVVGDLVDPPLQSESHHNNNTNSSLVVKIPDVLTSIYSNNLLGFCRFRLSNMTYYYMCAALVVVGTITSIASLITILLSLNSS